MKDKRVMIGLSGGINSMAVLCWLIEQEDKPKDIWLFYAHFEEHSPNEFISVMDREVNSMAINRALGYR